MRTLVPREGEEAVPAEVCRPLGTTLQLLARRLDVLLREESSEEARAELRRMRALVTEALHTLHDVSGTVDDFRFEAGDVERLLRRVALGVAEATGAHVEVRTLGCIDRVPASTVDVLVRITRDGLLGLHRHADASRLSVRLCAREGRVLLELEDRSTGPAPARRRGRDAAPVQASLARMVRLLGPVGGRLLVRTDEPRGICVQATVPVDGLPIDGQPVTTCEGTGGRGQ